MKKVRWPLLFILLVLVIGITLAVGAFSFSNSSQLISALFNFPQTEQQLQQRDALAKEVDKQLQTFATQQQSLDGRLVSTKTLPQLLIDTDDLLLTNDKVVESLENLTQVDGALLDVTAGKTREVVTMLLAIDQDMLSIQLRKGELYDRKASAFRLYQKYLAAIDCQNKVNFKTSDGSIIKQLKACESLSDSASSQYQSLIARFKLPSNELNEYTGIWLESQQVLRQSYEQVSKGNSKQAISLSKKAKDLKKQASGYDLAALISDYELQLTVSVNSEISALEDEIVIFRQKLATLNQDQWFTL